VRSFYPTFYGMECGNHSNEVVIQRTLRIGFGELELPLQDAPHMLVQILLAFFNSSTSLLCSTITYLP
jgi:hypothetical protein